MGHGDKSHFWSPLGLLKFQDFLSFLFIPKWSYSTFLQNYASTANTQKVMKFYNLGNENFETDHRTEKMNMYLIWSKQGNCDTKI